MRCPKCEIDIELSWKRYLCNPFSRYVCPHCSAKFKFKRPLTWYIWYVGWFITYVSILILVIRSYEFKHIWNIYSVVTAIMVLVYLPIDRKLESKYETKIR